MKIVLSLALCLSLAGCASAGRSFEWETARKVSVGMTEAELVEIMGKPNSVATRGDKQIWGWVHVSTLSGVRRVSFEVKDGRVAAVPNLSAF